MRAFLLAGGLGTRLHPITNVMPKCLMPINGRPALDIWLEKLAWLGVNDVLVNVSSHAEQVSRFLRNRARGPRVQLVYEPTPLGNAGTVLARRAFVDNVEEFWVCYADTLTSASLAPMEKFHYTHPGVLTMAVFTTTSPHNSGIVSLSPEGWVDAYEEKPVHPKSDLANAGIYLTNRAIFHEIPSRDGVVDFGYDVLPRLVGYMRGFPLDGEVVDIGTMSGLKRAQEVWV